MGSHRKQDRSTRGETSKRIEPRKSDFVLERWPGVYCFPRGELSGNQNRRGFFNPIPPLKYRPLILDRGREGGRETHRETDRQRHRETDRETETERDRERHRERQRDRDRDRDRETETHIETETQR